MVNQQRSPEQGNVQRLSLMGVELQAIGNSKWYMCKFINNADVECYSRHLYRIIVSMTVNYVPFVLALRAMVSARYANIFLGIILHLNKKNVLVIAQIFDLCHSISICLTNIFVLNTTENNITVKKLDSETRLNTRLVMIA